MAAQVSPDSVRLQGFPSCQNSLAWGGEHLAVAAGETVHILTPSHTDRSFSRTESVQVSRFSELEWHHQDLAALGHLSIGEEQSQCKVLSLAWSPPGLGLHRRSVLAVLTSNLVLSLWESNGQPGTWRRALVVSGCSQRADEAADLPAFKRRSQRIRAFAWLPSLIHANAPKWGTHLLAVANDNNLLSFYHVRRGSSPQESYEMKMVYQHQLPASEGLDTSEQMPSLENVLIKEARVSRIVAGPWTREHGHEENRECSRIQLVLARGTDGFPPPDEAVTLKVLPTATDLVVEDFVSTPAESGPNLSGQSVVAGLEQAIDASVREFDDKHHLQGYVRVRHWGHASDPTNEYVAAAITLHPSNMLESVDVAEDNILVLLLLGTGTTVRDPTLPNADLTIRKILSWVKMHTTDNNVRSELDNTLLRVLACFIASAFSEDKELAAWADSVVRRLVDTTAERNGQIQPSSRGINNGLLPEHSLASTESCQWCGASIPFTDKINATPRCSNSHTFNRCGLSFLSIQEPGVSKLCTRCGKEFLDTAKLKPGAAGPSLALDLFEHFDVCPYCQGKFSG